MESQRRNNPVSTKTLRDENGKWLGSIRPLTQHKFQHHWGFSKDEYKCIVKDARELSAAYLPKSGDVLDLLRNDRISKIAYYGLSKTWLPKLEQNLSKEQAVTVCEGLIRLRSPADAVTSPQWDHPMPSFIDLPRPALALTTTERMKCGQPVGILSRIDLGSPELDCFIPLNNSKRKRSGSNPDSGFPDRCNKQHRQTPSENLPPQSSQNLVAPIELPEWPL